MTFERFKDFHFVNVEDSHMNSTYHESNGNEHDLELAIIVH